MINELYKALTEKEAVNNDGIIILDGTIKHSENFNKCKGNAVALEHRTTDEFLELHKEHNGTDGCFVLVHEKPDDNHYRFALLSNHANPEDAKNYIPPLFANKKIKGYLFKGSHSPRDHTIYKK